MRRKVKIAISEVTGSHVYLDVWGGEGPMLRNCGRLTMTRETYDVFVTALLESDSLRVEAMTIMEYEIQEELRKQEEEETRLKEKKKAKERAKATADRAFEVERKKAAERRAKDKFYAEELGVSHKSKEPLTPLQERLKKSKKKLEKKNKQLQHKLIKDADAADVETKIAMELAESAHAAEKLVTMVTDDGEKERR